MSSHLLFPASASGAGSQMTCIIWCWYGFWTSYYWCLFPVHLVHLLYISTSKRVLTHPFCWSKYTFKHAFAILTNFFYFFLTKSLKACFQQFKPGDNQVFGCEPAMQSNICFHFLQIFVSFCTSEWYEKGGKSILPMSMMHITLLLVNIYNNNE